MALYEYDAYQLADEAPIVRIGRKSVVHADPGQADTGVCVLELRLDWSWTEPIELALGETLYVSVVPHTTTTPTHSTKNPYGLVAWGRCSAFVRKYGATMPLDMLDARVIAGLGAREAMERMLWMMQRPAR